MKQGKEDTKTQSRGLRMKESLWKRLDELAEKDRRKTSQYVILVLEDHVNKKQKT